MFYFHGKKDRDFCLLTDPDVHINGHFIGKKSSKGRDFTWVQSIGLLFGPNQLYIGANQVSDWHNSTDYMHIQLNGQDITIPLGDGETWLSSETGVSMKRLGPANAIVLEVEGSLKLRARVVPITQEESRIHGYDITADDCFAHLELGFKFSSLSSSVNGVLGQTYAPGYHTRVKMGAPMPIMGGNGKFFSSHLFSTDCAVSRFGLKSDGDELDNLPVVVCGGDSREHGMVCKR
jgi:Root cap